MDCATCGTRNPAGAETCAACGHPLAEAGTGDAGYPPLPPSGAPAGGDGDGRRSLLLVLAVVVVGLAGAAAFALLGGDGVEKVVLEPIDMVQEDDFTGNLDAGGTAGAAFSDLTAGDDVPDARTEQADARLAGRAVTGTHPAVYGGSRDTRVCDVAGLVTFLTGDGHTAEATAWAEALDVEADGIESYVGGLTAVRLRWDTRVTNHGFRDGEATPFQSLLQAGTAVLVDATGVPRVKCNCGNPLAEPARVDGGSEPEALDLEAVADNPDMAWEGLDPAEAVTIERGDSQVPEITLVDVDTGGLLDRPVGSDGASMQDIGTGDVQLTLTWRSTADLDLAVTEPDGTRISFRAAGPSATGGRLDVDSNVECADDGAVENIFWPPGEGPSGTYHVTVTGFQVDGCGPGDFTLDITAAGEKRTETGTVAQAEVVGFEFAVP